MIQASLHFQGGNVYIKTDRYGITSIGTSPVKLELTGPDTQERRQIEQLQRLILRAYEVGYSTRAKETRDFLGSDR